jgi:hypothetical protein
MDDDERDGREAEIREHREALRAIQQEWGFGPDDAPPPEVGSALMQLGGALRYLARSRFQCEPAALRWMGVSLTYWARAMEVWADASELHIAEWVEQLTPEAASTEDG